jgi:hypothetical protein
MKSAVSTGKMTGKDVVIAVVRVVTKVGDEHFFPAMELEALAQVIPKGAASLPSSITSLALVNASLCVLSIPFNIIRSIHVRREDTGKEEGWWSC